MARAKYPRKSPNLRERLHYRYYYQRKSSQQNPSFTLRYLHSQTANSPSAKSEKSSISNQSRPKTSSAATSTFASYKTTGPTSLPNLPRPAKPSENTCSLVERVTRVRCKSHAGSPVVALYEKNDGRHTQALVVDTSTPSDPGGSIQLQSSSVVGKDSFAGMKLFDCAIAGIRVG